MDKTGYDLIYSRFTFHSITNEQHIHFLDSISINSYLAIETRSKQSETDHVFYGKTHYRNYTDFKYLEMLLISNNFEIIYMNEDDNYNMCYKCCYKDGKCETIESYSQLERTIEKFGIENLVNMIITHCEEVELKAPNYINRFQKMNKPVEYIYWKELCKLHIQEYENKDDDYERDLVRTIIEEYVDKFLDKHQIFRGIYMSREFCVFFVEKAKEMLSLAE
jgi:hypothetical protein